jgi:6-phospho-3-hexuloisomerase
MAAGRSGLALKWQLCDLCTYTVFIVGETNTPAILEGDLLLVASGSGTTSSVVSSAEKAKSQAVIAITDAKSKIAGVAEQHLTNKCCNKNRLWGFSLGSTQEASLNNLHYLS